MGAIFKILILSLLAKLNSAQESTNKIVEFNETLETYLQNEPIETFFGTYTAHGNYLFLENRIPRGIRVAKKPQFINPGALARPADVYKTNLDRSNNKEPSNDLKESTHFKDTSTPQMGLQKVTVETITHTATSTENVTIAEIMLQESSAMPINRSTVIFDGDLLNTIVKTGSTTIDEFFGRNVTTQSYEDYLSSNFTTTLAAKRFPKHKNDPYGVLDALETHTFPVMLMIALILLLTVIMIASCVQMTIDSFLPRKTPFADLPLDGTGEPYAYAYNNPSFETRF